MAKYQLLNGANATNSAPTVITDGVPTPQGGMDEAVVCIFSTSGSGTMSVTCKLWGWFDVHGAANCWAPLGKNATAANKGLLNDGDAMGETGTNLIAHAELVQGLEGVQRVYLEVTAISGDSSPTVSAYMIPRRGR